MNLRHIGIILFVTRLKQLLMQNHMIYLVKSQKMSPPVFLSYGKGIQKRKPVTIVTQGANPTLVAIKLKVLMTEQNFQCMHNRAE